jgi:hypothetical protein
MIYPLIGSREKKRLKSEFDLTLAVHQSESSQLKPDIQPQHRFEVQLEPDCFTEVGTMTMTTEISMHLLITWGSVRRNSHYSTTTSETCMEKATTTSANLASVGFYVDLPLSVAPRKTASSLAAFINAIGRTQQSLTYCIKC